jgi:exosortase A-associated hydrolase 2
MTAAARPAPFEPVMLEGGAGPILAVHHPSQRMPTRGVIYLPPFAEEMNRARRMAALQAGSLSASGHGVLLLDPYGTGDSSGDFADARWEVWREDVARAVAWMRGRGYETIALLGLRLGALLALDVAREAAVSRVVLWQPVLRGDQMITQFLRLRLAADLTGAKRANESTADMRKALSVNRTIEVAGYDLHHDLVAAIDALTLAGLGPACRAPIDWIEVAAQADQPPPPANEAVAERWRAAGVAFKQHRVVGEPFWTLQETALAPALLPLTGEVLGQAA